MCARQHAIKGMIVVLKLCDGGVIVVDDVVVALVADLAAAAAAAAAAVVVAVAVAVAVLSHV